MNIQSGYILTIDVGTSSTKTALWSADGRLMAEASEDYPLYRPQATWAEMDAIGWWKATCATARKVIGLAGIHPREILGIGVDGLGWTLLPVDENCEPLSRAMIWLDRRADAEAAWLRSLPTANDLVEMVANPLDEAYITPKLLWLRNNEPRVFEAAHKFLTSTGFIVARLTGEFTCDYTQAYGYHFFNIHQECWDEAVANQLGVPLEKMPRLMPAIEIAGYVTAAAASMAGLAPGIPVIAGGLDACVGTLGAGVVRLGQTVDQGGQAGGMALFVDRVIVEPRLIFSHHILPGGYLFQSGTVGGGTPTWFLETLGQAEMNAADILKINRFELLSHQADTCPPGAHGVLFLPYMAGERTPLWNSNARGVFFGLSYRTQRPDLIRAIMEGCAFAVYHNLHIAEQHGVTVKEWIGVGGATRSPVWCQIKANVTNRPFVVARTQEGLEGGHLLGLYAMAAHSLGLCDDIPGCIENLLPKRTVYEPSPVIHRMYQDMFGLYQELSEGLLKSFDRLANITARHPDLLCYGEDL